MIHWQAKPIDLRSPDIEDWAKLHRECDASPLLHPDFLSAALREYGGRDTRMWTCREGGRLLAAAVLRTDGPLRVGTFQPSQAPIGFWLQRPDVPTADLVTALAARQPPWRLVLSITQQDPALLDRPADTKLLRITDYIDTARITVATDWPSYWQARGSNLRQNIRKARNRLEKAGKRCELRTITGVDQIADAVRTYGEIESRSWKASEGTAVSPDNDQGRLYTDLLRRFALRESARCYQLCIDDQVAATDLCILGRDEIVILKTTFDESFKDFSPAFLMRETAFASLFAENRFKRIEFYGRAMEWHRRWTDEIRTMYHLTSYRAPLLAFLRN